MESECFRRDLRAKPEVVHRNGCVGEAGEARSLEFHVSRSRQAEFASVSGVVSCVALLAVVPACMETDWQQRRREAAANANTNPEAGGGAGVRLARE
jgi:predicted nicotinamide N-methyase